MTNKMVGNTNTNLHLGIDVGSTTVKVAVIDDDTNIVYECYRRHNTDVRATVTQLFRDAYKELGDQKMTVAITGSGGLLLAEWLDINFVQEVIASKTAVKKLIPETDVAIELGGEDAKIIYFDYGIEQRMNGTCAGGTGSFIDQMASLLHTDAQGLNELSKKATMIYPIASRCGVFAKSDVQPLLNEGAKQEDIAASIFQSVVTQTIAGLACGRPIRGNVAFLGGPLQYLSGLRERFQITLELPDEQMIVPENAHLFVASGAALAAQYADEEEKKEELSFGDLLTRIEELGDIQGDEVERLDPLFKTEKDYEEFKARHDAQVVDRGDLSSYQGNVFIGIDAGSTTMKAAIIGEDGQLLRTWYGKNRGDVIGSAQEVMRDFYEHIPEGCEIGHVTCTGYGEALLIEALAADSGEVETVAHLRGAQQVLPGVEFILDVGGQDMKCLEVDGNHIEHIMLNEACSSGCGSFLETFADSMEMEIEEFAASALTAKSPVDLGSRCTVFMNSRVKQAQKEGATVGDISAGLSYSVMKNALFKVIKLRDASTMGDKVIVQGGTFLNDAVLRAFELLTGKDAYRPDIAGCMGAYGAALLARDRATKEGSTILSLDEIENLEVRQTQTNCRLCSNNCRLTINRFGGGRRFVTGNRCEKGAGIRRKAGEEVPNLFEYKQNRLFSYKPLDKDKAPRGTVGIPRVLNMFENYPFWFTFFTKLGFSVVLSDESTNDTYEKGMESMPSESVCYPAKLTHGHIMDLIEKDPDFIWHPCIRYERQEDMDANNCFNCPVVISYPEALKLNIDDISKKNIQYMNPFVPFHKDKKLKQRLFELIQTERKSDAAQGIGRFNGSDITQAEINAAVDAANAEDKRYKEDMRKAGEDALAWLEKTGSHGIVLAGRPYHVDREINHSIPELIKSYGLAVFTEDSVEHLGQVDKPIRVVDQWMYHSRLYRAAKFTTTRNDLDFIQLNSFGCGLDALTTDQCQEIIEASGKVYTTLKIDEVSNLGAARIRLRSLMAAIRDQDKELAQKIAREKGEDLEDLAITKANLPIERESSDASFKKVRYTKEMKQEGYTILVPQMAPIHFDLLKEAFECGGHKFVLLPSVDRGAVDAGLKYVNNDICYPSILVTGQIMEAITSGKYDLDKTAVLISQTGGACRATNYIALIRKALKEAGCPQVPVISLSPGVPDEKNSGFKFTLEMLRRAVYAVIYGDAIMKMIYRVRPYEAVPGSANALYDKWMARARKLIREDINFKSFKQLVRESVAEFDALPLVNDKSKPRVGVVGEILVKFHPTANNQVVKVIESEGCEAVVPSLADFFLYSMSGAQNMDHELGTNTINRLGSKIGINLLMKFRKQVDDAFEASERFEKDPYIFEVADKAKEVLSLCNTAGEGWLLTGEMVDLIEMGAPNIICTQPFGCLPNHVVGKATIKELRRRYPESNIVAVDYDPGASEVNQINRIKLMISVAKENFRKAHDESQEKKEHVRVSSKTTSVAEHGAYSNETLNFSTKETPQGCELPLLSVDKKLTCTPSKCETCPLQKFEQTDIDLFVESMKAKDVQAKEMPKPADTHDGKPLEKIR